jgi:hypothetical protein
MQLSTIVIMVEAVSGLDSMAVAAGHHSRSWTVDGCAKVGERQLDQHLDKKQLAPVRCCSFNKNSCHSKEVGCVKQTYKDAKHTCARHGMRLCSWHEMKTNLCCGTGCNFDLQSAWILRDSYGKNPSEFDPNSQGNGKAWILDGCPKVGERNLDKEVDEYQVAPVRCCSDSKASCHSQEIGCMKQTYSDAKRTCSKHGMRLCNYQEMKTNLCCGTGCNFDLESAWISRESYPRSELETVSETNVTAVV